MRCGLPHHCNPARPLAGLLGSGQSPAFAKLWIEHLDCRKSRTQDLGKPALVHHLGAPDRVYPALLALFLLRPLIELVID